GLDQVALVVGLEALDGQPDLAGQLGQPVHDLVQVLGAVVAGVAAAQRAQVGPVQDQHQRPLAGHGPGLHAGAFKDLMAATRTWRSGAATTSGWPGRRSRTRRRPPRCFLSVAMAARTWSGSRRTPPTGRPRAASSRAGPPARPGRAAQSAPT